jgi:hypothetical protein
LVVRRLEEAKEADLVLMGLVVKPVTDRGDTAYYTAVHFGDEVLGLGVLEERVPAAGEEQVNVTTQRRDPDRVPRVELVRKVDEASEIPPIARR